MGSGCGDLIVEKSFVLRANSPSRWHLTRGLLLCSQDNIHDLLTKVNKIFQFFTVGNSVLDVPLVSGGAMHKKSYSFHALCSPFAVFPA